MYKHSSEQAQDRGRRNAEYSTHNSGGLDPTAFAGNVEAQIAALVAQKQHIEVKLGQVKAMIAEADLRRGTWHARSVRPENIARWQNEKRLLLGELNGVATALSKLRLKQRETNEAKHRYFEQVFMDVAKEILAGPVYDRVTTAALHRFKERTS